MAEETASRLPLATLNRRFGAVMLDGVLLTPLLFASTYARWALGTTVFPFLTVLLFAAYEHVFLVAKSATPGKLLLGIYVARPDGGRISASQAILRYLAESAFFVGYFRFISPFIGLVPTLLLGVSFFMALDDDEKRAIHDHVANTRVLRGKPPTVIKPDPAYEVFPRL